MGKVSSKALILEQLAHSIAFGDWAEQLRVERVCAELRAQPGILEMATAIAGQDMSWLVGDDSHRVLEKLRAAARALEAARKILGGEPCR